MTHLAVSFRTLGCKVNRVESDTIAAELLGRGVRIVDEDSAAVIVINTCTVTAEADAKARKAVRQALKAAGTPVVVVTGCLAAIDAPALQAVSDRVVVEVDKERIAERVAAVLGLDEAASPVGRLVPRVGGFRTRVPVKVQDGCDRFCAYCIVPHARGIPRSRRTLEVLAEVRNHVDAGVREVVLTGINIGRYRDGSVELPGLLRAVCDTGCHRVRLSSVEPPDVTDELVTVLREAPAAVEHLHIPLQSGSDAVLAAMGRGYSAADYAERVRRAAAALPGLACTTDVICGFPGESEDDHQATMALCDQLGLARLHVFRYSARAGTPAAAMPEQVSPETKARRAAELRELDATLRRRFAESQLGARAEVLVERVADGIAEGTTRNYLRVRFPSGGAGVGEVVEITLEDDLLSDE